MELVDHAGLEVILIGGRLFKHSIVAVGTAAIEAIGHLRADLYFMGVTGVHASAGLSAGDLEEAYVKRAQMACAAETVLLASAEKINAASAYISARVSTASAILVEKETRAALIRPLTRAGTTVVRA